MPPNYGILEIDVMAVMNVILIWNNSMFYGPKNTFKFSWGNISIIKICKLIFKMFPKP